eukprot:1908676-Pyramimonas_sp.AAC.1
MISLSLRVRSSSNHGQLRHDLYAPRAKLLRGKNVGSMLAVFVGRSSVQWFARYMKFSTR